MAAKEAQARIKINKQLEESGWRFFDHATGTEVSNAQAHVVPALHELFSEFLCDDCNDPARREAPNARTEIETNLLHRHYLSQKDIGICLAFDIGSLSGDARFPAIKVLFDEFAKAYKSSKPSDG